MAWILVILFDRCEPKSWNTEWLVVVFVVGLLLTLGINNVHQEFAYVRVIYWVVLHKLNDVTRQYQSATISGKCMSDGNFYHELASSIFLIWLFRLENTRFTSKPIRIDLIMRHYFCFNALPAGYQQKNLFRKHSIQFFPPKIFFQKTWISNRLFTRLRSS